MEVRVRILEHKEGEFLAALDEGQDFDRLFTLWCKQDDDFCADRITEKQWMDIETFLEKHGVTILESESHVLADYYE